MAIIADHHKWKDPEYELVMNWPDDTYVQWGSSGVVLGNPSYKTAFFEAFPNKENDAGGFIRGEGDNIEDAERDAYQKFITRSECKHHWGRENYKNGGQMCRHCRAFRSNALPPIYEDGCFRKPLSAWECDSLERYENPDELSLKIFARLSEEDKRARKKYQRWYRVRKNLFGCNCKKGSEDV